MNHPEHLERVAKAAAAYLSQNHVGMNDIPEVIAACHKGFEALQNTETPETATVKQATPGQIKRSITPDYLICMEDGKQLKMLKRYLRSRYEMTPDEYRKKWGLPADYPMVAPNYAQQRSEFAKRIGLGKSTPGAAKRKGAR